MSEKRRKRFFISEDEQQKYAEMQEYVKKFKGKSGKFADKKIELNIDAEDSDLYFAYNFVEAYSTIKARKMDTMGDKMNNSYLAETLKVYKEQFFSRTGYIQRIVKSNNGYYERVGKDRLLKDYNPWHINTRGSNVMDEEFSTQLSYNSRIELIAKNMIWANRATKEVETIKKNVVMTKSKGFRDVQKYADKFEEINDEIFNDTELYEDQNLAPEFLDRYSAFLSGDFELDEIKKDESYKRVEQIISDSKSDITVEEVFKYTSLSTVYATLYQMKSMYIQMAVKEVDELKKSRKLGGIRIAKSVDELSKSERHNYSFQILIPGYNSPFRVHADNKTLISAIADKSITFEEKDFVTGCMSACVYKFNNEQKDTLQELSRRSIGNPVLRELVEDSIQGYSSTRSSKSRSQVVSRSSTRSEASAER